MHYGKPLEVRITDDGRLMIEVGVNVIAHAVSYSDWANPFDDASDDYVRTFAIEDATAFAKDVILEMEQEKEDGSTPLSDFLDAMTEAAVENGSMALFDGDVKIPHGETHPCETWAVDETRYACGCTDTGCNSGVCAVHGQPLPYLGSHG